MPEGGLMRTVSATGVAFRQTNLLPLSESETLGSPRSRVPPRTKRSRSKACGWLSPIRFRAFLAWPMRWSALVVGGGVTRGA
jgi:hypothetical protein